MNRFILYFLLVVILPFSAFAKVYSAEDFEALKRAAIEAEKSYSQPATLKCKEANPVKPTLRQEFESYMLFAEQEYIETQQLPHLIAATEQFLAQVESGVAIENVPASEVIQRILIRIQRSKAYCGMTAAEAAALASYIGNGYHDLNKYLRGNRSPAAPDLDRFELLLNRALNKIANKVGYLYRSSTFTGGDYPDSVYRLHKIGSELTYGAFTSTAWTAQYRPNFILYSYTAKDISPVNPGEKEVLFHSRTRFKVLYNSCEEQNLSTWQGCNVLMTEIPAA